jgi:adenosylmethionine-8-amino-7-oxononanoate aminotransferase
VQKSIVTVSVGHCHPRLIEALKRQADEVTFTYRFAFSNEPMLELADLLREISPMPRTWSFFNSSGSESVESAIHLALLYWQLLGQPAKTEFISRYPSYHGSTIAALGLSGTSRRDSFEALLTKNAVAQTPNADIRARRTPADEVEFAIKQLEDAIADGFWTHDIPGTALWLNTSFSPVGHTAVTLSGLLASYGVAGMRTRKRCVLRPRLGLGRRAALASTRLPAA